MIGAEYTVDFSSSRQDLQAAAKERLLTQFQRSPLLLGVLHALVKEIQVFSDAVVNVMEARTLANARGENLTVLGRIVGTDRTGFALTELPLLTQAGQVIEAEDGRSVIATATTYDVEDDDMLLKILIKIHSNQNQFSSIPELTRCIKMTLGIAAQIEVGATGPMSIRINVPAGTPASITDLLLFKQNNTGTIDEYLFPYPVTADVSIGYY